ncbi:hypothetical protein FQA39_LY05190 [Lamprigera yunnana]|nr:hypothetical protein FQA39_LY05190 [Lamprigera yunnana]
MNIDQILISSINLEESTHFLRYATWIFNNNVFDIVALQENLRNIKATFTNEIMKDAVCITREEVKQVMMEGPGFRESVQYAVTTIIQHILIIIEVVEEDAQIRRMKYNDIVVATMVVKKYLLASRFHVIIAPLQECISNFIVALINLLQRTDYCSIPNIYAFTTISEILYQFKDVDYVPNIILKEIFLNLKECNATMNSFSQMTLFELAFYEKLMHNLQLLKNTILHIIEEQEVPDRTNLLSSQNLQDIHAVLMSIQENTPPYINRLLHECLNLTD